MILDVGNDGLPRMAVLMAAFPTALENWISEFADDARRPGLGAALAEIAGGNAFELARAQLLQKLRGTLLGYDDARNRIHCKFLDAMNDIGTATAVFNQQAAITGLAGKGRFHDIFEKATESRRFAELRTQQNSAQLRTYRVVVWSTGL